MSKPEYREYQSMTVKELKDYVRDLDEVNDIGDDNEVWMTTGKGISNWVFSICPLNHGDILFSTKYQEDRGW